MSKLALPKPPIPAVPSGRITFEEFLARDGDVHVEWVNGEVVPMSAVVELHAEIAMFAACLLKVLADARKSGVVRQEPFQMKTGPDLPSRAPDVMFIANRNRKRLKRLYVEGPADLVIEVISPESRSRDRGEKFYEYEQGGVREYWLIDPHRLQAEFYLRGTNGIYKLVTPDADGLFHSKAMPGLWLKVDWLWQRPLPSVVDVFKLWGIV